MTEPINITGRWVGAYFQNGHERPIAAEFAQFDTHLQGQMTDGDTDFEASVFEAALAAGLPPGSDEQIVVRLREQYPETPRGPITAASRLPAFSRLEGEVRGRAVHFLKVYIGTHFSGWKIGDQFVGATNEGHAVEYAGLIGEGDNSIEGRWHIDDPESGAPRLHGGFVLRRRED